MGHYIIHHEGVFNIWSTIIDSPIYESGFNFETLKELHSKIYNIPLPHSRLARALKNGSSSLLGETLDGLIAHNHAGENGSQLSKEEFIKKYL